jgi:hypothetical protein
MTRTAEHPVELSHKRLEFRIQEAIRPARGQAEKDRDPSIRKL